MTRSVFDLAASGRSNYSKVRSSLTLSCSARGHVRALNWRGRECGSRVCVRSSALKLGALRTRVCRRQTAAHTEGESTYTPPASYLAGVDAARCVHARVRSSVRTWRPCVPTHAAARVWQPLCGDPNEGRQASKLGRAGAARAAILLDSGWKTCRALVTTTTTHHVDAADDEQRHPVSRVASRRDTATCGTTLAVTPDCPRITHQRRRTLSRGYAVTATANRVHVYHACG